MRCDILCRISYEPSHEIMALFVLPKLILQTSMRSHQVGLDVWFLVGHFVYFYSSGVRTAKALARLRGCAGSPESSLVACVINTIASAHIVINDVRPSCKALFILWKRKLQIPEENKYCIPLKHGMNHVHFYDRYDICIEWELFSS